MSRKALNWQQLTIVLLFLFATLLGGFLFGDKAKAFGACSDYGPMAYESGGYCRCMSGYVMGEGLLGGSYCISEDQACKDQYGYNARSSLGGGCECRSGYVFEEGMFGDTQCVNADGVCRDRFGFGSEYSTLSDSCECGYGYVWGEDVLGGLACVSEDQACKNQLGLHSRATYGGQCECSYGYVIHNGKCTYGDAVCRSDHGMYASYNNLTNRCECDDDYTFDDLNQCVEKQHNVYFKLIDINPEDGKELLIKSEYDRRNYIVRVGVGCLETTISRYEGKSIVVNLGTDYDVDVYDTVVLHDSSQTCSILQRERTYNDSFPEPLEEDTFYYQPYVPPVETSAPTIDSFEAAPASTPEPTSQTAQFVADGTQEGDESSDETESNEVSKEATTSTSSVQIDTELPESGIEKPEKGFFSKIVDFFRSLF